MPATNVSPQLLNDQEVIERLKALRQKQPVKYTAFYSSQLGGIVTDPALMVLPFDDHMGIAATAFSTPPASSTAGFTISTRTSIGF